MGKRILISSFGSHGDIYPYIGLALGLRDRGHEPVLATAPNYRAMVEREGLAFHPVRPDLDPTNREVVRRIMDPAHGTEFILKELVLPSLRESYHDLSSAARGADLVLTHPVTFSGPIVAERAGLPWLSTVLAPMSFFSRHDLPVFPPMPWAKRLEAVPGAASLLVKMAKGVTRSWMKPVHDLRQSVGLPPGGDPLYEGQHSPEGVLALFSRVLAEPQPDWPPNVRIVGAVPYNGPTSDADLPPTLRAFLDDGPAPVVFTLGTSAVGAAGDFYRESLEAVRALGIRAVFLIGSHAENQPDQPLPSEVMAVAFAPHAALFPHAAAVVHQGGAGTLHQALRAGRPTLVVPFAHDQPDNAYRVERLGTSRTIPRGQYRARRVERELRRLLEDPGHARRADEIGTSVRSEDAVTAACDEVARMLA
jgi:UDP:flavonoid glycosyltransferase YjiC (YdhE family)